MEVQKSPDVWLIKVSDGPMSTLPRFLILYLNIEKNSNSVLIFLFRYFKSRYSVHINVYAVVCLIIMKIPAWKLICVWSYPNFMCNCEQLQQ